MRQIKFRAWDKNNKTMGPVLLLNGLAYDDDNEFKYILSDKVIQRKEAELIQFTGLLDKNGKEIFEGDIVKNKYGNLIEVKIGEIQFSDWEDGCAGYGFILESHGIGDFNKEVEVIGNIYENPELLNGNK